MVGELIMLPVRVGVRATRLWFRAVEETFSITTSATGRVVELLASRSPNGTGSATLAREAAVSERPSDGAAKTPVKQRRQTEPVSDRDSRSAIVEREPSHVSEEPELVEEFAEPGAEQGAGPEIHVNPPWEGYERMNAKQIISRLAGLDPAGLAAVQLYESSYRNRQTILNAVERELRASSSPRTNQSRRTNQKG